MVSYLDNCLRSNEIGFNHQPTFFQVRNPFVANSKAATEDLQTPATERNTVMCIPVTSPTIARFEDATSPTLTHQVSENT